MVAKQYLSKRAEGALSDHKVYNWSMMCVINQL